MPGAARDIANWMAGYDVREVHTLRIGASSQRVYRAAKDLLPSEVPLLRTLFALRSLPARVRRRTGMRFSATVPLIEQMMALGFTLLDDRPDEEIILGLTGKFWRPGGGMEVRPADADEFLRFDEPGYAKAVVSLCMQPLSAEACLLSTETRVAATDDISRRKFAVYWLLIRPGSGLIRRMWLRAVRRRAEAS